VRRKGGSVVRGWPIERVTGLRVGLLAGAIALLCALALASGPSAHARAAALADPDAPVVSITMSPGPGVHDPQVVSVSAVPTASATIVSRHYTLDGAAEQTYTAAFTITRPGTHRVSAAAIDDLGRRGEAAATVVVTTDSAIRSTPIQGPDRIYTAIEGSKRGFKTALALDPEGHRTVVLATAYNWPDALGAATLAGAVQAPVLLTDATTLPTAVAAELVRLGADRVFVVGGTAAVADVVIETLLDVPGIENVERLSGADRYVTAIKVAERSVGLLGESYQGGAFIATGASFPDALGASAVAASAGMPTYLAPPGSSLRPDVGDSMVAMGVASPVILGGTKAVSGGIERDLGGLTRSTPLRLAGADRYGTSLATARWAVETRGMFWDAVALATGRGFPDAIAGGPVQGHYDAVMLLTEPSALNPEVETLLRDNRYSISEVRFLGGEAALGEAVRVSAIMAVSK